MNIDQHLAAIYAADRKGRKLETIGELKLAIATDQALEIAANARKKELDALIAARGEGACAYSTKYRTYLAEALA